MASPYKILGQGTFGVVFEPALPNVNATGQTIQFPGMVTKLFHSIYDLETLQKAVEDMKEKVPTLVIDIVPYQYPWTYGTLNQTLRKQINRATGQRSYDNTYLNIVRMPNLGDSCRTISNSPQLYRKLRAIPVKTLATEILKCMRIVKNIKDAGYIHGDIRDENVLCNVCTGTLTIIDFDWFRPAETFFAKYPREYFYAHPPEMIFILFSKFRKFLEETALYSYDVDEFIDEVTRELDFQFDVQKMIHKQFSWVPDQHKDEYKKEFLNFYRDLYEGYRTDSPEEVFELVKQDTQRTLDSYGLAIALDWLLFKVRMNDTTPMSKFCSYMLDTLLPGMLSPYLYDRLSIEAAIANLESWIRENIPEVQLGDVPDLDDELRRLMIQDSLLQGKRFDTILNAVNVRLPQTNEVVALANVTTNVEKAEEVFLNGNRNKNKTTGGRRHTTRRRRNRKRTMKKN
jgi:serine/threonine protein kinase